MICIKLGIFLKRLRMEITFDIKVAFLSHLKSSCMEERKLI